MYREKYTIDDVMQILVDDEKIKKLNLDKNIEMLLLNVGNVDALVGPLGVLKSDLTPEEIATLPHSKEDLLRNAELHMKKIANHSDFVNVFCTLAGIPERGDKHDDSKWSPEELFESIYFYEGTRSPIDKAHAFLATETSPAFIHHTRVNDHQLENSIYLNGGMVRPYVKPLDASIEVICDFCGAAKAYLGEKFSFQGELDWWKSRLQVLQAGNTIHPKMAEFITKSLGLCAQRNGMLTYEEFQQVYEQTVLNKSIHKEISVADDVLNNDSVSVSTNTVVDKINRNAQNHHEEK